MSSKASTYLCQIQKQYWVKIIYKYVFKSEGIVGKEVLLHGIRVVENFEDKKKKHLVN